MLLFLKHQLHSLKLGSELAAEASSKKTCLEDLVLVPCRQGYAFSSLQDSRHRDESGLGTSELLCKEKLLLHIHCRVASHLVVDRGTSFLQSLT